MAYSTFQNKCNELVECNVYYNITTLMSELNEKAEHFPEYRDDIYNAFETLPDFRACAEDNGWRCNDDEQIYQGDEDEDNPLIVGSWEEACEIDNLDFDDYRDPIFEHWIVSNWLADKLQDLGERVLHNFMGINAIWCRSTTGQPIAMDFVIEEVVSELNN